MYILIQIASSLPKQLTFTISSLGCNKFSFLENYPFLLQKKTFTYFFPGCTKLPQTIERDRVTRRKHS